MRRIYFYSPFLGHSHGLEFWSKEAEEEEEEKWILRMVFGSEQQELLLGYISDPWRP